MAAFRATLEGIEEASLILHMVDSSQPHASEQIVAVEDVLSGLQIGHTPRLIVWNKIDLLPDRLPPAVLGSPREHSLAISARTGQGLAALLAKAEAMLGESLVDVCVLIPYDRYELVRLVYGHGAVVSKEDTPEGVRLRASVPAALSLRLAEFAEGEAVRQST